MTTDVTLDLAAAVRAVADVVRVTPLVRVRVLEEALRGPVFLKLESLQETGSFKVRGAAARMSRLDPTERSRGVVTCSSGNHGRAVAFVASRMGVTATIFVPTWVDPVKLRAIRACGARVEAGGATYDDAERLAFDAAERHGLTFVHPFDDPWVVAGQATLGLEILDELPEPGRVLVPLSGGGLAGGVAFAVKERSPATRIVAVSAEKASVMLKSLDAGAPVSVVEEPTLASALAGGIGLDNRWTFRLVRDLVDRHLVVTESHIADAVRFAAERLRLVVEGGGAVGLAAALAGTVDPSPGSTVIVLSGGNLDPAELARLLIR